MIVVGALASTMATIPVLAEVSPAVQAFERCKAIDDDSVRLNCLRSIKPDKVAKDASPAGQDSFAPWRLVETLDPQGDRKAVSIMRTADAFRSDPDFAGLMVRCGGNPGDGGADLEVLIVLLYPLPLRSHPNVRIRAGNGESRFKASIAVPGALVRLPAEATMWVNGPWQGLNELAMDVEDTGFNVHGVVALDGLPLALRNLSARCPNDAGPPR